MVKTGAPGAAGQRPANNADTSKRLLMNFISIDTLISKIVNVSDYGIFIPRTGHGKHFRRKKIPDVVHRSHSRMIVMASSSVSPLMFQPEKQISRRRRDGDAVRAEAVRASAGARPGRGRSGQARWCR